MSGHDQLPKPLSTAIKANQGKRPSYGSSSLGGGRRKGIPPAQQTEKKASHKKFK